ncbi:MAG: hypothetical protein HYZ15_03310 [Sphingobacteriales bacterium]|nr:hypothetical protein [Sphingobacteriales bacterium]
MSAAAVSVETGWGQVSLPSDSLGQGYNWVTDANPHYFKSGDTVWVYSGICKTLKTTVLTGNSASLLLEKLNKKRPDLIKIHGNVQYDFTYRSLVDTPFSQSGYSQHSVRTTLDATIKEQYPVRITLLTRQSNSPFFKDLTDVSIQFNQRQFLQQINNSLAKQLPDVVSKKKLSEVQRLYQQKKWEAEALQSWISDPGRLQELVEEKERLAVSRLKDEEAVMLDSLNADNVLNSQNRSGAQGSIFLKKRVFAAIEQKFQHIRDSLRAVEDAVQVEKSRKDKSGLRDDLFSQFQKKKQALDSIKMELTRIEWVLGPVKRSVEDSVRLLKQQLSQIKDPAGLKAFIKEHNLSTRNLPKGWQALSAIQSIGIGRTWVDYTELTVQHISLTGVNAEFTPGRYYIAFAAGRVNYQFRDFVIKNNSHVRQNLYLIRAGLGAKEGNHLIASWYDGRRSMLNWIGNMTSGTGLERVIGMSFEARLQASPDQYIVLESAKSSFHTVGAQDQTGEKLINRVWNFKDRSNEAYSIRVYSNWRRTNTKLMGYYRKMGEHFQSFNLQPVNVNQVAYQFKLQQQFWKRRLSVEAGIRKNDFFNPFVNPGLASKTVFKSALLTLRVPRYPMLSIGYYPSSQLTMLDNSRLVENQYNTLSAVISHAYSVKKLSMSSSAVLLKFYNSGADTGFIYFNATSVSVNHFIFLKGVQLQSGLTLTRQRDIKVTTLEQSMNYQVREWLSLVGGLKYNRLNAAQTLLGATGGFGVMVKGIGTLQASYEKSYLPGTTRNLLPVDMGRLTFYRVF